MGANSAITDGSAGVTIAAPPQQEHKMTAYDKGGLKIIFLCGKVPDGASNITARFCNTLDVPMTDFLFEVAVPKCMSLTMNPASSQVVPQRTDNVTQNMSIVNESGRGLGLKLRIKYSCKGQTV